MTTIASEPWHVSVRGVECSSLVGVYVRNRADLIAFCERTPHPTPFLSITLPCGERVYETPEDVPANSVKCECGTLPDVKEHWFIQYEDDLGQAG